MPSIGPTELIVLLVIVLMIVGPGKLADLGGAVGRSLRDFRRAVTDPNEDAKAEAGRSDAAA